MADKPSRALVVYGDGLAHSINRSHTHIHSLAFKAACGFLSLPNAPPLESEDERIVREFAYLVDAFDGDQDMDVEKSTSMWTLYDRFMKMKAAVVTDNPSLKSFGSKLGFTILSLSDLHDNDGSLSGSSTDSVVSEILKLLGFHDGKTIDTSQFDLVFVHIGNGETVSMERNNFIASDVEYINALVGSIMHAAQSGSEIGSRLHLSLVMSYGNIKEVDTTNLSVLVSKEEMNSKLSSLLPRQSYTMRGEKPRNDVRHHCPMLVAQWQYAVTRIDKAETFSFKDFKEHGGNLVIPADRFLHEVAFKLWKAPKYGA